ncbi:hypothetical protein HHL17_11095 [Chitinophaga sp. G-6-1-13]|uniref:Peptidase S74 domain-containing protein n=1 Tax=Chitinophaga fulva TaxID=2728842 RepID=A0A848GM22_9BACT|nr:hypothetical protein [Chitinophaga fulva]NML37740.1 hypothetical protein [Chitinophaga fulva]
MNRKHPFILCSLLLSYIYADAQTPNLQLVTEQGSTTTKSIGISNDQGLNIGVDASTGYTVKSHFIRPLNASYRTLRFDCSSVDANGGWEFYNSGLNTSLMYVKQGGNIGIGTTTPQAKLEVRGDIKSSTGIFRALTGTLPNDTLMSYGYNLTVGDYTSLKVAGAAPNSAEIRLMQSGNVGIGTQNPQAKLEVRGDIKSSTGIFRALTGTLPNDTLMSYGYNLTVGDYTSLKVAGAAPNNAEIRLMQSGNVGIGSQNPQAKLEVNGDVKSSSGIFRALTGTLPNDILMSYGYNVTVGDYTSLKVAGATPNTAEIRLTQNGNVGIGTQNPQSKLAVNGMITATRVKVTQSGWADFVFQDGYRLPSLTETEAFIKKNKRLPDIPSEEQVKANGVDVGETQAKLLQKIEELTLHLIELNNKVTAQQQLLMEQGKEIERLKR